MRIAGTDPVPLRSGGAQGGSEVAGGVSAVFEVVPAVSFLQPFVLGDFVEVLWLLEAAGVVDWMGGMLICFRCANGMTVETTAWEGRYDR